jgi:hypothetical protein
MATSPRMEWPCLLPDRYSDPSSGLDQTAPWCCGGPCRHLHIRRADNDSCARGLRGLSRLHDSGRGWGHGWGMSQYGAYGAARKGLTWKQILAFYYPGTRLSTMSAGIKIRVRISADNDSSLRVLPATGLTSATPPGTATQCPPGRSTFPPTTMPLRSRASSRTRRRGPFGRTVAVIKLASGS